MRLVLLILALLTTQVVAIERRPSEKMCATVFQGEVISVESVRTLTNRSASAELCVARVKVLSVTKQDAKLANEVAVYYVYDGWQVCPRCVDLKTRQRATFYCYRGGIGGKTNVLYVPMATFVESLK
jgi:hypothetical protein